jgi:hypothetical protein
VDLGEAAVEVADFDDGFGCGHCMGQDLRDLRIEGILFGWAI